MSDENPSRTLSRLIAIEAKISEMASGGIALGGSGPHDPGMEARLTAIEQSTVEIRQLLRDLAPKIEGLAGFAKFGVPSLATKADLTSTESRLRSEIQATKTDLVGTEARLREEIQKRPTRRQSITDVALIVGLIGGVLTIGSRLAH